MCPFSSNRFSPRAYDLLNHRVLVPGMGFIGSGLKSNRKMVRYSHNIPGTIALSGMSYQASRCSAQGSQLSKTDDYFSPLEACIAPSRTI